MQVCPLLLSPIIPNNPICIACRKTIQLISFQERITQLEKEIPSIKGYKQQLDKRRNPTESY